MQNQFALLVVWALVESTVESPCVDGFLGKSCGAPPRDCRDILNGGQYESGVYTVYPRDPHGLGFPVYCDMTTDDGGWLVFQRRSDGSEDFFRDWETYERGFGRLGGEFWLGNYKLHLLTSQANYELRIDMEDFDNAQVFAKYDSFGISGPLHEYKLSVSGFHGTTSPDIGDSFMAIHNNQTFTTKDHGKAVTKCAVYKGGWWYGSCHFSNLNGLYLKGTTTIYAQGVVWKTWKGYHYSLKSTEMKIRPSRRDQICS